MNPSKNKRRKRGVDRLLHGAHLAKLYLWISFLMAMGIHLMAPPWSRWQTWLVMLGNALPLVDRWYLLFQKLQHAWPAFDFTVLVLISGIVVHQIAHHVSGRRRSLSVMQHPEPQGRTLREIHAIRRSRSTLAISASFCPVVRKCEQHESP